MKNIYFLILVFIIPTQLISQEWLENFKVDSSSVWSDIVMSEDDNGNVIVGVLQNPNSNEYFVQITKHNSQDGSKILQKNILLYNSTFTFFKLLSVQENNGAFDVFYKKGTKIIIDRIQNNTIVQTKQISNLPTDYKIKIGTEVTKRNGYYYVTARLSNLLRVFKISALNLNSIDSLDLVAGPITIDNQFPNSRDIPGTTIKQLNDGLLLNVFSDSLNRIVKINDNFQISANYPVNQVGSLIGFDIVGNKVAYVIKDFMSNSKLSKLYIKFLNASTVFNDFPVTLPESNFHYVDYNDFSEKIYVHGEKFISVYNNQGVLLSGQDFRQAYKKSHVQIQSKLYYATLNQSDYNFGETNVMSLIKFNHDYDFSVWSGMAKLQTGNIQNIFNQGNLSREAYNSAPGFNYLLPNDTVYRSLGYFNDFFIGGVSETSGDTLTSDVIFENFNRNGPTGVNGADLGVVNSIKNQKIYYVTKNMIDNHIANHNTPNYTIPLSIKSWPAHGDVSVGEPHNIAHFVDVNNNGFYEPNMGEYPAIKGDEAMFYITTGNVGKLKGDLPLEFHVMLYTYDCDSVLSESIFTSIRIINRTSQNFKSLRAGVFSDLDIGGADDDYCATNAELNFVYAYNGDIDDQSNNGSIGFYDNMTSSGTMILKGVPLPPDNIDNQVGVGQYEFPYGGQGFSNGIVDDEVYAMNRSIMARRLFPLGNDTSGIYRESARDIFIEEYHYGPSSIDTVMNYFFPKDTDLQHYGSKGKDVSYLSEEQMGSQPGDKRALAISDSGYIAANDEFEMEFAFFAGHNPQNTTVAGSVDRLFENGAALQQYYAAGQTPCGQTFGYYDPQFILSVPEKELEPIKLYPNPAKDRVVVENTSAYDQFQVFDYNGRLITSGSVQSNIFEVNTSQYANGFYVIRLLGEDKVATKKFIISH